MAGRYNRLLAMAFLILGGINVLLGGWLLLLGRFNPSLVIEIIMVVTAVLYLSKPYFIVEDKRILMPAPFGPVQRSFWFEKPQNVKMEGNKIMVQDGEKWKSVPVYRWKSDPPGWQEVEDKFSTMN
jgi:hypothetical protein